MTEQNSEVIQVQVKDIQGRLYSIVPRLLAHAISYTRRYALRHEKFGTSKIEARFCQMRYISEGGVWAHTRDVASVARVTCLFA
jgi:hypothetical protein